MQMHKMSNRKSWSVCRRYSFNTNLFNFCGFATLIEATSPHTTVDNVPVISASIVILRLA